MLFVFYSCLPFVLSTKVGHPAYLTSPVRYTEVDGLGLYRAWQLTRLSLFHWRPQSVLFKRMHFLRG